MVIEPGLLIKALRYSFFSWQINKTTEEFESKRVFIFSVFSFYSDDLDWEDKN